MAANTQRPNGSHHKKRHGKHQRHSKEFLKTYWPYIPMLMVIMFCLSLGWKDHTIRRPGVLAYATNVSVQGLLNETNVQRTGSGLGNLTHNLSLSRAAQAKANDMVARNYWSHNTPDGQEPWTFIDKWGYAYAKAGENLAYGFLTSGETVKAWMNSEGHRLNILDSSYREVGFGFANSQNFQNSGPQTIVVAMYANPLAVTQTPPQPVALQSTPTTPAPTATKAPLPSPSTTPTPKASSAPAAKKDPVIVATSDNPDSLEPPSQKITKAQTMPVGSIAMSATSAAIIAFAAIGLYATKHAFNLTRALKRGEEFILHHPLLDALLISAFALSVILGSTSGVIK